MGKVLARLSPAESEPQSVPNEELKAAKTPQLCVSVRTDRRVSPERQEDEEIIPTTMRRDSAHVQRSARRPPEDKRLFVCRSTAAGRERLCLQPAHTLSHTHQSSLHLHTPASSPAAGRRRSVTAERRSMWRCCSLSEEHRSGAGPSFLLLFRSSLLSSVSSLFNVSVFSHAQTPPTSPLPLYRADQSDANRGQRLRWQ